jgi:hypothetical protein
MQRDDEPIIGSTVVVTTIDGEQFEAVYMGRGDDPVTDLIEVDEPEDGPRQYYGREAVERLRILLSTERDRNERRRLRRLISWCAGRQSKPPRVAARCRAPRRVGRRSPRRGRALRRSSSRGGDSGDSDGEPASRSARPCAGCAS